MPPFKDVIKNYVHVSDVIYACRARDAGTMHYQHTSLSVIATPGLVYTTHHRSVLYTLLFECAEYTFMMVCSAHHKRCAYRDIGSTPYLV